MIYNKCRSGSGDVRAREDPVHIHGRGVTCISHRGQGLEPYEGLVSSLYRFCKAVVPAVPPSRAASQSFIQLDSLATAAACCCGTCML